MSTCMLTSSRPARLVKQCCVAWWQGFQRVFNCMRHAAWQLTQAALVGAARCAMHAKVSCQSRALWQAAVPLTSSKRMQGPAQQMRSLTSWPQLPPPWHGAPLTTARIPTPLCALLAPAAFKPCRQCGWAYLALVLGCQWARR